MNGALMNALCACGFAGAYAAMVAPGGAVVLMYHSVADDETARFIDPAGRISPSKFETQMEYIASERAPVSMDDVAECVRGRVELAPASVAVTFDDGYLDNLTLAAPVLSRLGIPATLYLPTALMDSGEPQWIDRLFHAFEHRSEALLRLNEVGGEMGLDDPAARERAYGRVREVLLSAGPGSRERILSAIEGQLRPTGSVPRMTMTWEEVRRLVRDHPVFSVGAHTVSHRDISACDDADTRREILGGVDAVESVLGCRPRHFSFPYGRATDAGVRVLREAGMATGVASGSPPRARPGSNPLRISRVPAPRTSGDLRAFTHPAFPDLPMTLLGRV